MDYSNRRKSKQQLITLLEPRRLMSVTGGTDFTPTGSTPAQYVHVAGFEHALAANAQMPAMPHFFAPTGGEFAEFNSGMDGSDDGGGDDAGAMEGQFARAIAQGAPVYPGGQGLDNDNGATAGDGGGADHAVHVNTLAVMYAELSTSTVNSIDAANGSASATVATLTATDDTSFSATLHASTDNTGVATAGVSGAVNAGVSVSAAASTVSAAAGENTLWSGSSITPAVVLPSSLLARDGENVLPETQTWALPHVTVQNVEQELLTVSNLASEMIAQLGRDIAIEMSHLESDLGIGQMAEQFTTHWDGWRSAAAVTGAAIATIVYVQSETDREKPKAGATFSTSLIQAIPS